MDPKSFEHEGESPYCEFVGAVVHGDLDPFYAGAHSVDVFVRDVERLFFDFC